MLKFRVLNGYASKDAGHAETVYDTTLEDDVKAAAAEFERLTKEGRVAVLDRPDGGETVTEMPKEGDVYFLLPMQGG